MNPDVLALTWRAGAWEDQGQGQRVAVVRRAFFDEGRVPSGLVADVVLDSWRRCLEAGMRPGARPVLEPVSRTRTNYVTGRDHVLLKAARGPFDELQASLARSRCKVMLIDRAGVLLRTTPPRDDDSALLRAVTRPGVDLGELLVGTNAPSLAVQTGASCVVGPGEHYYDVFGSVRCVAAPIHNRCGTRVAVLDLTIEHQPFGFDAVWLVSVYASAIESNLRIAQTRRQVLVRLHPSPAMLDGAGLVRQFFSITIPQLRPTLIFVIVTSTIGGLQIFDEPRMYDQFGQGGASGQWMTITIYLYNLGWGQLNFGRAAAVAWLLFLIIVIVGLINLAITRSIASGDSPEKVLARAQRRAARKELAR